MDEEKLNSLLQRLLTAEKPDRSLDAAICVAVGFGLPEGSGQAKASLRMPTQYDDQMPVGQYWVRVGEDEWPVWSPEITSSVDAALALMEHVAGGEGTRSMVYTYDLNWHASAHAEMAFVAELRAAVGTPPDMRSFHAQAFTMPAAILSALLKLLINETEAIAA